MKNNLQILLWIGCLCMTIVTHAQSITVKGKVTSENEPIPGVNVVLKGTTTGTSTDLDGNYALQLPDGNGTLVFSYIGYTAEEVPINNRTTIDVSLVQDIQTLSEVVVV